MPKIPDETLNEILRRADMVAIVGRYTQLRKNGGLSVTALAEGAATVSVSTDTAKIKTAINDFLTEYNKTQSGIDTQTASTTDARIGSGTSVLPSFTMSRPRDPPSSVTMPSAMSCRLVPTT